MSLASIVIGSITLSVLVILFLYLYLDRNRIKNNMDKLLKEMTVELEKFQCEMTSSINHMQDFNTTQKRPKSNQDKKEQKNSEETLEIQNMVLDMTNLRRIEEMKSRHYAILRKAAKDMIDSIVHIPEFRKNEENIPLPPVDSNPVWSDLVKNHIKDQETDLSEEWRRYMDSVNRCTELKMTVLKEYESYLIRGTGLERSDNLSGSELPDSYYIQDRIYDVLNHIFFNKTIKVDFPEFPNEGKKSRKIRNYDLLVNGKIFIHSSQDTVTLIMDRTSISFKAVDTFPLESMKQLKNSIDSSNLIAENLTSVLNWFIFENTDMIDCHMIGEMKP